MQFEWNLKAPLPSATSELLNVAGKPVRLAIVRNPRARRYILRVRQDGSVRVTVPRRGSVAEARALAARQTQWIERQLQRLSTRPPGAQEWIIGTPVFLRGELVPVTAGTTGEVVIGPEHLKVGDTGANLRPQIERHFWKCAARELPIRVGELAAIHASPVRRVSIRNQRSRWGSCSRQGCISLNWRLIQSPGFVRDYIILHELMHLREMNHSARFWREVESVCPDYRTAEIWLKEHRGLLR